MAAADAMIVAGLGGTGLANTGLAVLGLAGGVGVGLVFLQAALGKLRHRDVLAGVIANYRLLPGGLVGAAAMLLPPAELAVGLGLLLGGQPLAALAAIVLLVVFAAAMGINILRGRTHIDCGCGRSQLRQPLGWSLVARNLVLAALLLPLLAAPLRPAAGLAKSNLAMSDLAVAMAGGLAVFVIVQLFNAIGALAASPLAASRR